MSGIETILHPTDFSENSQPAFETACALARQHHATLVTVHVMMASASPLAIVVVGGMIMTLLLNRYLMPVLYSFYGHREPPTGASNLAH